MQRKLLVFVIALVLGLFSYFHQQQSPHSEQADADADVVIELPSSKYPETAAHIQSAIEKGKSAVCTIQRKGAAHNRDESLRGVPTKPHYDRDEWPMAMCKEGGKGADIAYISPSDNRGAGSYIANQVENYPDGTRVKVVVK